MKKLLVLAQHPELAESLQAGLNPEQYRVLHRASVEDAEPLLARGLADACIVDVELTNVQGVWFIEKLRRRAPKVPIIIYTDAEAMLKEFLLRLREILSINRAAIFLRQPLASFEGRAGHEESRRLRAACAVGLSPALLEHFELSFEAGIGARLFASGRILRRDS